MRKITSFVHETMGSRMKGHDRALGALLLVALLLIGPVSIALAAESGASQSNSASNRNGSDLVELELPQAQSGSCNTNPANVLSNGGFEAGTTNWTFFTSGSGRLDGGSPAAECNSAAHVTLTKVSNNMQLYQSGFLLKANTRYRLSFSAFSSSGNDIRVYVQRHGSPYSLFGLDQQFNLTTQWQNFSTEFTSTGFNGTSTDTRLRFWPVRYAANNDVYHFDNVVLEEIGSSGPPAATATPPTPGPTAPPSTGGTGSCSAVPGLLQNADFEKGRASWNFYTNGSGSFEATGPAFQCSTSARVTLNSVGSNTQLYQSGFSLRANSRYRLTFAAYSSSGKDLQVYIQRHGSPYATFGLNGTTVNLGNSWSTHSVEFTASGFSGTTADTRLRFWFSGNAGNGDVYYFDAVSLEEIGGGGDPTPPPSSTATPQPSATPPPGGGGGRNEMVVFDWNGPVTEAQRGFPYDQPPRANGDWTSPVNFAQGTLQYRVEIRSQPRPQNMRIQFCFWQAKNGNNFALENCGPQQSMYGVPGAVATWSVGVADMWKLGGKSIEWNRARYRNGAAIKNSAGEPVSNYNGWNWNGENPAFWYPLNMRYTVVVVAKGATFSGWSNYR